ncbi:GDSL esterase/lipase 1 [Morella rubra]|uniref:GDSL esterase/lipase 1 n=1 Tax=Morella rubra TaxID=262757 RepID=A0A6A1V4Y3_9ROSI|nr:GDSL esterase/lipase 1 [Morella rubra]
MMSPSFPHFCFLVLCASLVIPTRCLICLPEDHVALFIFGDSLFDAGNNNYINTTTSLQANYWPYGESFFKYPTGRHSVGRLIPDFIGKLTYSVIDLNTQLNHFEHLETVLRQRLGEAEAKKLLARAVYLFSVGGNDYAVPFTSNSSVLQSYSQKEYVDMVIGNLTSVIKEIYEKGGRKFAVINMAPLGCVPLAKALNPRNTGACIEELTSLATLHNKALSHHLQTLASQLKGFRYSNTNFNSFLTERMNDPSKYGFKEGKSGCCGTGPYRGINSCGGTKSVKVYELCENPSEYLFFDSAHPTERANQQLAELMWNGDLNITRPYSIKELVKHW